LGEAIHDGARTAEVAVCETAGISSFAEAVRSDREIRQSFSDAECLQLAIDFACGDPELMQLTPNWQEVSQNFAHVALAYILTASIGWEREREAHSAGVRTFPIVGMASCGYLMLMGEHPGAGDQSRLLQGLITGIGFIGGGAILKDGSTVRGTATAASVWNAGVIGAAVAMNHFGIALTLAALNLFSLRGLLPLKKWLDRTSVSEDE
jgi:putative Mg2+ transporter-C (MgtC) family protein